MSKQKHQTEFYVLSGIETDITSFALISIAQQKISLYFTFVVGLEHLTVVLAFAGGGFVL